jgi:hypothetical protein
MCSAEVGFSVCHFISTHLIRKRRSDFEFYGGLQMNQRTCYFGLLVQPTQFTIKEASKSSEYQRKSMNNLFSNTSVSFIKTFQNSICNINSWNLERVNVLLLTVEVTIYRRNILIILNEGKYLFLFWFNKILYYSFSYSLQSLFNCYYFHLSSKYKTS